MSNAIDQPQAKLGECQRILDEVETKLADPKRRLSAKRRARLIAVRDELKDRAIPALRRQLGDHQDAEHGQFLFQQGERDLMPT